MQKRESVGAHLRDREPLTFGEHRITKVNFDQDDERRRLHGPYFRICESSDRVLLTKQHKNTPAQLRRITDVGAKSKGIMRAADLCRDGIFLRVTRESGASAITLEVTDLERSRRAVFSCHEDDLAAPIHGVTFQSGNAEGHLAIVPEGSRLMINLNLTDIGSKSCSVERDAFEQALRDLDRSNA